MNEFQKSLAELKIVPVVTPYTVQSTIEMTKAMVAGGIGSVEITLRTDCAWDAIKAVQDLGLPVKVGVGTITNANLFAQAEAIQADFAVSPGISNKLLARSEGSLLPLLPGIATASELMQGMDYGISTFKLFPAMAINAPALLSSFAGPFPEIKFCPTGGVTTENAAGLLARPNVVCVGGSWMVSKSLVESGDWSEISRISAAAMAI
ncbi:bifunctional 4-hydroxy-2-oxoglutarate aldolase/2-dehydro-3-deoxy-phosphogluconate aldolase [Halioxenophilus aromaticivorans]|uniref:2-dehydro-3-deoxy-phosphogluconate aldolase n=1 Tax=Halioxenophilus aromaticivorans TaxID=1306992 RepID=A0AAV3TWY3_9ALTE